ncbi:MAG: S9 family peptidase [Candidatus Promineifilaceae bacterium]
MNEITTAPYGTWESPITADLIATGTISLGEVRIEDGTIYWVEMRPDEGGRYVIMAHTADGKTADVTPAPFNARTRVHEYGGGAYVVFDGTVYFSHFKDNRLYIQEAGIAPKPLTPEGAMRYADLIMDRRHNRLLCIREDHSGEGEAVNTLVAVNLGEPDEGDVLVSGNNFYSSPRISPDGTRLVWLTWNHPNMPWDGTELWMAKIAPDGSLGTAELIAGGKTESIFQPEWSPDGQLYFVSDRTGWWNIYRLVEDGEAVNVCEMAAEFGRPQWVFGMSSYAFISADRILCSYMQKGNTQLAMLSLSEDTLKPLDLPYTSFASIHVSGSQAAFVAASPTEFNSVVRIDLADKEVEVLRKASEIEVDEGYLSMPETIEFPTEGGLTAYAYYYAPENRDFRPPEGELPPLVVKVHGGPTGSTSSALSLEIQFWTSRGFALVDVNYGGSANYGREYRERLREMWGIVDVDDAVNGALYLVQKGLVDGERLVIRGGSAGGYTTLSALAFRDVFKAGASYFGISDLEVFIRDTHKFESRYIDGLVGPYPEMADRYRERSAIHYIDNVSAALLLLQGLEDKIVPPNQAEIMLEGMRKKGLPVAYLPFEGEQHGFRRAETKQRALEAELYFYSKVFGFEAADQLAPLVIENL